MAIDAQAIEKAKEKEAAGVADGSLSWVAHATGSYFL
jgi:hypothetical protein